MNTILLETKGIANLSGKFYIPAYQRGYRWTDESIKLIEDVLEIENVGVPKETRYCLQPVVVKNRSDGSYELIDGQQRLTTIYLIYKAIKKYVPFAEAKFSLIYEIRYRAEDFLKNLSESSPEDNIDFFYMKKAFMGIVNWFDGQSNPSLTAFKFYSLLSERVELIWYEVGAAEDGNALFQRLNIGKIPLTSSELVKAIFLSESNKSGLASNRKNEIALQWDSIEKELHDSSFWGFITNIRGEEYQTRIDLILNLISGAKFQAYEKYETFYYFDNLRKSKNLIDIWQEILHTFLVLKDWYKNHELYHKIGYLIGINLKLSDIFKLAKGKTKRGFITALDEEIKKSIKSDINYSELSYENSSDYKKIARLLFLFNVEATRQNGEQSMWFPFDKYKNGKWSLEHIHAQQSEGMTTVEEWKEWLALHMESVKTVGEIQVHDGKLQKDSLEATIKKIQDMMSDSYPKEHFGDEFKAIRQTVETILSDGANVSYLHSISNLALLNARNNAALSNAAFDAKRNKIIELDKKGEFIPYCTKMVFLKYYTKSAGNQVHFWGQIDRESYVAAINSTLSSFLPEKIIKIGEVSQNG